MSTGSGGEGDEAAARSHNGEVHAARPRAATTMNIELGSSSIYSVTRTGDKSDQWTLQVQPEGLVEVKTVSCPRPGSSGALVLDDDTECDFSRVYFSSPTDCGICEKFVWGVTKKQQKGQKCVKCGLKAHKKCVLNAGPCSAAATAPAGAASQSSILTWRWDILGVTQGKAQITLTHLVGGNPDCTELINLVIGEEEAIVLAQRFG